MKIRGFFRRLKSGKKVYVREHSRKDKKKSTESKQNTTKPQKSAGQEYADHISKATRGVEEYRPPQTAEEARVWDAIARRSVIERNRKMLNRYA